jgi:hypothetical protein
MNKFPKLAIGQRWIWDFSKSYSEIFEIVKIKGEDVVDLELIKHKSLYNDWWMTGRYPDRWKYLRNQDKPNELSQ